MVLFSNTFVVKLLLSLRIAYICRCHHAWLSFADRADNCILALLVVLHVLLWHIKLRRWSRFIDSFLQLSAFLRLVTSLDLIFLIWTVTIDNRRFMTLKHWVDSDALNSYHLLRVENWGILVNVVFIVWMLFLAEPVRTFCFLWSIVTKVMLSFLFGLHVFFHGWRCLCCEANEFWFHVGWSNLKYFRLAMAILFFVSWFGKLSRDFHRSIAECLSVQISLLFLTINVLVGVIEWHFVVFTASATTWFMRFLVNWLLSLIGLALWESVVVDKLVTIALILCWLWWSVKLISVSFHCGDVIWQYGQTWDQTASHHFRLGLLLFLECGGGTYILISSRSLDLIRHYRRGDSWSFLRLTLVVSALIVSTSSLGSYLILNFLWFSSSKRNIIIMESNSHKELFRLASFSWSLHLERMCWI